MAEQETQQTGQTTDQAGNPGQTGKTEAATPITFTPEQQEAINRLIAEERRKAEAKSKLDTEAAAKRAKDEAEAAKLKEQGEYQKLFEAEKARATEADKKAADAQIALYRLKAAQKHGLKAELADRLRGTTEDEIDADALELKKQINAEAAAQVPGTPAGSKGSGGNASGHDAQKIKERAAASGKYSL